MKNPRKKATNTKTKAAQPAQKSVDELLSEFLPILSGLYACDYTAPGIVESYLPNGAFYVSIVRYDGDFGKEKRVIASGTGPTRTEAVEAVLKVWHQGSQRARRFRQQLARRINTRVDEDWQS